ncbi:UNVERIFIED_CONTAM: Dihydroflavonol 4-reductase, partial [Sesamum radiatum]
KFSDFLGHGPFGGTIEGISFVQVVAGRDRLRLFRADLLEDGSFDEAVIGCDGVFHVAASMEFGVPAVEDLGNSPYLSLSVRVVGLCAVEAFDRGGSFRYAEENGIDLISVITTTVGGPFLTPTVPSSIQVLSPQLQERVPLFTAQRLTSMEQDSIPAEISSKKIRDMGFEFKYGIQDIIHQTIRKCVDYGFLPPTSNE